MFVFTGLMGPMYCYVSMYRQSPENADFCVNEIEGTPILKLAMVKNLREY